MGTRIQALALYRSMLRVCRRMDYQYGNWDTAHILDPATLRPKKINKMAQKRDFGALLWNNVRAQYKVFKYEEGEDDTDELLDYGFDALRKCNQLNVVYDTFKLSKKTRKMLLPAN